MVGMCYQTVLTSVSTPSRRRKMLCHLLVLVLVLMLVLLMFLLIPVRK